MEGSRQKIGAVGRKSGSRQRKTTQKTAKQKRRQKNGSYAKGNSTTKQKARHKKKQL